MRLMVMFDLPVETKVQQRQYRKFHKHLIENGFLMLQYSVYTRYCNNDTAADKFSQRIHGMKPICGNIRILRITENQFENMILLVGEKTEREKIEKDEHLIVIE